MFKRNKKLLSATLSSLLIVPTSFAINLDNVEWEREAFLEQNKIENRYATVSESTILQAHNAFNSTDYGYSIDPNHRYTFTEMVELGARSLEIDMYTTTGDRIIVCHGLCDYVGDDLLDRFLTRIVNASNNNGDYTPILIQIEKGNDDIQGRLADIIATVPDFADKLYTPLDRPGFDPDNDRLEADEFILDEIRDAGKLFMFYGGGVGSSNNQSYRNTVFNLGPKKEEKNTSNLEAEGMCNLDHTQMYRVVEDHTNIGRTSPRRVYGYQELREAMDCGVNMFGLDSNEWSWVTTTRLNELVWSWKNGLPNSDGQHCAIIRAADAENQELGYFTDLSCETTKRALCKSSAGDWAVTDTTSSWATSISNCTNEYGPDYTFSMPVSKVELAAANEAIRESNDRKGFTGGTQTNVWIDYAKRTEMRIHNVWTPFATRFYFDRLTTPGKG
ncbi:hypothetical protein [Thalassomonas sp. RHCl1]|uniref:hypothetical protein n=1 Tax=Thalassomonas sp. RHCl1 TaxID=2995320 RepID=UPI00248B8625|nr:hypothetical protein [Thalassomonas sp. RHCl1]